MVDLAVRSAYLWRSEQREDDATDCPVWGTGWRRCAGLQHTLTGVLRTGRALTATFGASDPKGWPAIKNLAYGELTRPAVWHPMDDGSSSAPSAQRVTTPQRSSRCYGAAMTTSRSPTSSPGTTSRCGCSDDNPNWTSPSRTPPPSSGELRAEGHQVLVYRVRAEQRTPSVALAYALRQGATPDDARAMVAKAIPNSRRRGSLSDQAA